MCLCSIRDIIVIIFTLPHLHGLRAYCRSQAVAKQALKEIKRMQAEVDTLMADSAAHAQASFLSSPMHVPGLV